MVTYGKIKNSAPLQFIYFLMRTLVQCTYILTLTDFRGLILVIVCVCLAKTWHFLKSYFAVCIGTVLASALK